MRRKKKCTGQHRSSVKSLQSWPLWANLTCMLSLSAHFLNRTFLKTMMRIITAHWNITYTQEYCTLERILLHLNKNNSQRSNQTKLQEKASGNKNQKKNRKHMCKAVARDGRPAKQSGTKIPGWRPNLTLLVSTDTSLSVTLGQRLQPSCQCCNWIQEAGYMGTHRGMKEVWGRAWWMFLFCLWYGLKAALTCLSEIHSLNDWCWWKASRSNQNSNISWYLYTEATVTPPNLNLSHLDPI